MKPEIEQDIQVAMQVLRGEPFRLYCFLRFCWNQRTFYLRELADAYGMTDDGLRRLWHIVRSSGLIQLEQRGRYGVTIERIGSKVFEDIAP